jgi:hypothetical protein
MDLHNDQRASATLEDNFSMTAFAEDASNGVSKDGRQLDSP